MILGGSLKHLKNMFAFLIKFKLTNSKSSFYFLVYSDYCTEEEAQISMKWQIKIGWSLLLKES